MKAIKFSALFLSLACMIAANAQVAVNITGAAPAASSMLDISSTTRGLLIPRMTESNRLAISTPATGLIVYQTDQISGFWVYDGSTWKRLYSGTGSAWDITGNSGTTPGTHFLGTTDNQDFEIRTNNVLRTRITTKGQIETYNTGNSVFLGQRAGELDDLTDNRNVYIGYYTGQDNTTGENNTAAGAYAMATNTTGSYNTAYGYSALTANSTGISNTAIGYLALATNSTGTSNSSCGHRSLWSNTTAGQNVAIGNDALRSQSYSNSNIPWNSDNVAVGFEALFSNQPTFTTNGIKNTAVGNFALHENTTGAFNTAYGHRALYENTTGHSNTACGTNAMAFNTTGYENIAVGRATLYANTTAYHNIAIGYRALYTQSFDNGGTPWESNNIAIGIEALYSNQPTSVFLGTDNTAVGNYSLRENITGSHNVAIGSESLNENTTGWYNSACGRKALKSNSSGWNNTAMGYESLYKNTSGQDNCAYGQGTLWDNTTASNNIAIGFRALYSQSFNNGNTFWDSDNIAIGFEALFQNEPTSTSNGIKNTALGNYALHENLTGTNNTAIGYNTLYDNLTGSNNVATGLESLTDNTTGSYNTADGYRALYSNTTGYSNTACGMNALAFNTTGYENTAVGRAALYSNTTAYHNIAMGYKALYTQSFSNSGTPYESANIAIGCEALYSNQPTDDNNGFRNIAIGHMALRANTTGWENTALGSYAFQVGTYSNSTALGAWTGITASDQVRVGSYAVTSIGGLVGWTTLSDARFKRNIKEDVPGLEFIMKLRPVTYYMDLEALADHNGIPDSLKSKRAGAIQSKILYTGFLAQEVEEAAQSLGFDFSGVDAPKNENDYYGLRYAEFTVPLVKAVQEQQGLIDELGSQIRELEQEVLDLKEIVEQVKQ